MNIVTLNNISSLPLKDFGERIGGKTGHSKNSQILVHNSLPNKFYLKLTFRLL